MTNPDKKLLLAVIVAALGASSAGCNYIYKSCPDGTVTGKDVPCPPPPSDISQSCHVEREDCLAMDTSGVCIQSQHASFNATVCGKTAQAACDKLCVNAGLPSIPYKLPCTSTPQGAGPSNQAFCNSRPGSGNFDINCTNTGRLCTLMTGANQCNAWASTTTSSTRTQCVSADSGSGYSLCGNFLTQPEGKFLWENRVTSATYTAHSGPCSTPVALTAADKAYGITAGTNVPVAVAGQNLNLTTSGGRMVVTYVCDNAGEFCYPSEVKDFSLRLDPITIAGASFSNIEISKSGQILINSNKTLSAAGGGFRVSALVNGSPASTFVKPSMPITFNGAKVTAPFTLTSNFTLPVAFGNSNVGFANANVTMNIGGNTSTYVNPALIDAGTSPGVSTRGFGLLEVFITSNGQVKRRSYNAGWSNWQAMPSLPSGVWAASSPVAVSWSNVRTDVLVIGSDKKLYHSWANADFSYFAWEVLGSNFDGAPGISSWGSGRLDIFARQGTALKHRSFWQAWSAWETLPGTLAGSPTAVSWGSGRIDVAYRTASNTIGHLWFNSGGPWFGPEDLGGSVVSDVSIASWGVNQLDIVGTNQSGQVMLKEFNSMAGWIAPQNLGGSSAAGSGIASWGVGRIDIFTNATGGELGQKWLQSGSWWGWITL